MTKIEMFTDYVSFIFMVVVPVFIAILVFFALGSIIDNYVSGPPRYLIRTNDGIYTATDFKHFGDSVTFKLHGETVKKSQSELTGVVIERIK